MKPTFTLLAVLLLAPLAALLAALHAAETQPVSTSATAAADFSYAPPSLGTGTLPPPLPKSTIRVTVNRGSLDPDFGAFCTLPNIAHFHGRLFVTWNIHAKDEDQRGQRIQMRHSSDGGKTWLPDLSQPPVMLSPSLGAMLEMLEKSTASKSVQWNSGFAFTDNGERLWAIANEGTSLEKGRGLLALELKRDATRGEVLWLEPEPVTLDEGYPVYRAMNNPEAAVIGKSIRAQVYRTSFFKEKIVLDVFTYFILNTSNRFFGGLNFLKNIVLNKIQWPVSPCIFNSHIVFLIRKIVH
jgi:hypothetical protein